MTPGTGTRVDAVLDHFTALLVGQIPSEVEVVQGDLGESAPDECVMLAPADPDTPGVVVTYTTAPQLGNGVAEQIEFSIVLRSYSGGGDQMPYVRERCAFFFDALLEVIRSTPKVAGIWDRLELGPQAMWAPVYTDAGCNCYVTTSVVATGLI